MRIQIKARPFLLAACLSLAATVAFAGDGPAAPPAPAVPPPPDHGAATATPNPPMVDEAALQARLEAARRRMEVAAQQLAALSAQMSGRVLQHYQIFDGPPHALIGAQLDVPGGTAGARVREVSPGGPAEKAGLRAGDLIVAVNGTDVRGQDPASRVVKLLSDVRPGDEVRLHVLRDGRPRDLAVVAQPGVPDALFAGRLPPLPKIGSFVSWPEPVIIRGPVADMELARLTPGLGRYFGTDTGVLVVRAPRDGALGLQDGDVILSIGGRKPIDSSHVIRILGSYDPGEKITLQVLRLHRTRSVATTMPAEPAASRRMLMIGRGGVPGPGAVVRLRSRDRTL